MYEVVKRNGDIETFDVNKIRVAVKKAFTACDKQYNDDTIDFLSLKVISDLDNKISNSKVSVEDSMISPRNIFYIESTEKILEI